MWLYEFLIPASLKPLSHGIAMNFSFNSFLCAEGNRDMNQETELSGLQSTITTVFFRME